MKKILAFAVSHALVFALGFVLGVYLLPILAAPPAPGLADVQAASAGARYTAEFRRNLKGSDPLHWGEGILSLGADRAVFKGRLAPGPAYKLYLVPQAVETGADFLRIKSQSLAVADIKTFENFIVTLPPGTPLERYTGVVVWCESFEQFITAGAYK